MIAYILAAVFTALAVIFIIWYIARTPTNLKEWYGWPVVTILAIAAIICWIVAIF